MSRISITCVGPSVVSVGAILLVFSALSSCSSHECDRKVPEKEIFGSVAVLKRAYKESLSPGDRVTFIATFVRSQGDFMSVEPYLAGSERKKYMGDEHFRPTFDLELQNGQKERADALERRCPLLVEATYVHGGMSILRPHFENAKVLDWPFDGHR